MFKDEMKSVRGFVKDLLLLRVLLIFGNLIDTIDSYQKQS